MKITVEPIRDSTIRSRKKKITTEKGKTMSVSIAAERHSNPGRTKWDIELANDKEDRTRTNNNGDTEPTENEAMRQFQMAREEYEDEQKENTISYEQLASTLTEKLNELAEKDQ